MHTLHQDPATRTRAERAVCQTSGPAGSAHAMLGGLNADQALAYAKEVQILRRRVAALELELAASKVASPGADAPVSEFESPTTPAVSAATHDTVQPAGADPATEMAGDTGAIRTSPPHPDPGFAEAWSHEAGQSSFEERIAERAFFRATTVDEESRTWLLSD